ncbi:orotate phosphoribosyltransferase [Gammaproteobacteria bacterium]|nr:orotate phosphoribosyltransferase [Gammaproteobacteria bacterium]MDC0421046.1 orotate phosphoribosyltransferase [Gammaproteobacteria bacterium]MDC1149198.1 orotate phosphoribosyltransferase [Gammaproteobacteria bacterium]MDC1170806.1 orotate phosphoribosyltransferase [Gammaproteobacteria bacterium]
MKDYQKQFLELALDAKVLEFGDFTLKSGRKSPYFFNASKMLNGGYLHHLAECYREAILDSNITFDCIYGPAYKGIFLGSIVSMILSKDGGEYPLSFNRKEVKDHGEGGTIIGNNPSGDVLIIDDVISAGTAAKESIETIKELGANPKIMLVGLDRQEKGKGDLSAKRELETAFEMQVVSIINLDTLISYSQDNAEYKKHLERLISYRDEWGA